MEGGGRINIWEIYIVCYVDSPLQGRADTKHCKLHMRGSGSL